MSIEQSGEQNMQGDNHAYKCRIPQRLPPSRLRNSLKNIKPVNYSDIPYTRPKSASKTREDTGQTAYYSAKSARTDRERFPSAKKKLPSEAPKESSFTENLIGNKAAKQVITVPLVTKQKQIGVSRAILPIKDILNLPDQETINIREDLETQQDERTKSADMCHSSDLNERDSITSRSEKIMQLKTHWQETIDKFEGMKIDLNERQRTILELYASLRNTHQKLNALGHKSNLPPADDLQVMNISKMTPNQLLKLCSESKRQGYDNQIKGNDPLNFYIHKMNNMPKKMIALCEETLVKRKEIIDWFDTLRNQEKGCTMSSLKKKINEFNAENEMLNCSLGNVKNEFVKELNDIFDFLRKCVNETIALQLRTEELTCAFSDINSKNTDLQKQMYNADQCRSYNNKSKISELEKLLKEEKQLNAMTKGRLVRAEGQVKIGEERAMQLEIALNQARVNTRNLERTVQQLSDQNRRLQVEFDKELGKLNQSIKENTFHLEEIGDAREKLQTEKEDLEKRLEELSSHYDKSLDKIKKEQSKNVTKIIEIEKKYNEELEERKKRDTQIESLCTQLFETEMLYKDTTKSLEEQKSFLANRENEMQALKIELDKRNAEVEDHTENLLKQNETIQELENNLTKSRATEKRLNSVLSDKEIILAEHKLKQKSLEEQLRNRDLKMNQYENQLLSLKKHLTELQQRWSDIENLRILPEMVNEQNTKLVEVTRQNSNLTETLEKKNVELEQYIVAIKEQENILERKENTIKILLGKEEEQENIIQVLKSNLEMRDRADSEINQQLINKNDEIKLLQNNLEIHKQQIDQLEKIILKLENEVQNSATRKRKDEEKIYILEKHVAQYESYRSKYKKEFENPADNLDNLIKMLEEELSSPIEQYTFRDQDCLRNSTNLYNDKHQPQSEVFFREQLQSEHLKEHDSVPTKIEMGNFVKKTYVSNKKDRLQLNHIDCNTNVLDHNVQKFIPLRDTKHGLSSPPFLVTKSNFVPYGNVENFTNSRDVNLTRNLHYIVPKHLRDEKKRKMFELARHKL